MFVLLEVCLFALYMFSIISYRLFIYFRLLCLFMLGLICLQMVWVVIMILGCLGLRLCLGR